MKNYNLISALALLALAALIAVSSSSPVVFSLIFAAVVLGIAHLLNAARNFKDDELYIHFDEADLSHREIILV